jgi:hypothetical protein
MPFLNAKALETDPKGLAYLRLVLGRAPQQRPRRAAAGLTGGWRGFLDSDPDAPGEALAECGDFAVAGACGSRARPLPGRRSSPGAAAGLAG